MLKQSLLIFLISFPMAVFAGTKVRIGWQVPWAVQGQLVQILKNTDILKKKNLEVEFVGRTYGPELNELALASQVDVILTADQPAAGLFGKSTDWSAISRLMYNRTATYVSLTSPVKTLSDLKGKTIGVPIGAAAQRITSEALAKENMNPEKDVKWINLGIQEHMPLILRNKSAAKWDQFDALSGFDPVPAILESQAQARIIHVGKVCSLIVANKDWVKKNNKAAQDLVAAFAEAYQYYRTHTAQADEWFMKEAKFAPEQSKALALASSLEPNLKQGNPVSMKLNSEDLLLLQKASDFVSKTTGKKIEMKNFIDPMAL